MQHRLGCERGFIIRDSGVIGVPSVFEGAAHINDDAALAAHLYWRRRRTGDARRPHLSQQLAPATRHRRTGRATPPIIASAAAQSPTRRACRAVQPPPALVSDPRHLSHTATLCLTNTDISSVPYKTPWNFYREGTILPVFGFVYPEVRE